ncbi:MAG: nuclear transport factor 2 family protein [Xanthomonadaceae bacterium]|nr:nuclear transport factor 2 family protein [Xanthomonadaceae bacterium]
MTGTDRQDNRALVDRYLTAYIAFDVAGMCALLDPEVVFENYSDDVLTAATKGVEAFRRLAEDSAALFATRAQKLVSLRLEADRAIAVIDFEGVLARDIEGGPAAGSVIALTGKSEFEFRGGAITRIIDRS